MRNKAILFIYLLLVVFITSLSTSVTPMVAAGRHHTVGLKSDGTVVAMGSNFHGQCNVSGWSGITLVSAGYYHTVGLKRDGKVVAVGENGYGQCNVNNWGGITQVSTGFHHTLGLKSDGTVVAVGRNNYNQCDVSGWSGITQVSGGIFQTVGLKSDGTVVAVGRNNYSQCDVSGWSGIIQVSAGYAHTVGLKSDGTVVAVGSNDSGQCDVSDWSNITRVSSGAYHTLGLKSDGTVVAVGSNDFGQCDVNDWSNIIHVSGGSYHTVGLKSDGTVVTAGRNDSGQCNVVRFYLHDFSAPQIASGNAHTVGLNSDGTLVAVGYNYYGMCDVSGWSGITQVSAGSYHTVGLKSDGTVVAVGRNNYGQCDVSGWDNITRVSAGGLHTVGLKSDGTVVAMGQNDYGQCKVRNWSNITQVSGGNLHTVGLKSDGTVVAIGENGYGQCNVSGWSNITRVSCGIFHTLGVNSDGTVVAVGRNNYGQCDVSGWRSIIQVSGGIYHTVGLKSDGTVVAVGSNDSGQCKVKGWSNITQVSAGYAQTVGLKSDGTMVAVGRNKYGQCDVSGWNIIRRIFSGTVKLKGAGLKDVVISGLQANPVTNDSGYYVAYANSGWSGTATPTRPGYTFIPASRNYINVTSHQFNQDYSAILTGATITVTSPNGGEEWLVGSTHDITWTGTVSVGNVKLEYTTNNGNTWIVIDDIAINDGVRSWVVPNTPSPNCKIRISETDGSPSDTSDSVFSIVSSSSKQISLSRSILNFGAKTSGSKTPDQVIYINNSGTGTLNWSVSDNVSWLSCSPSSGTNAGSVTVSVEVTGLSAGIYTGTITVSDPNASNSPQTVSVTLKVYGSGQTSVPFGPFGTPLDGSTVRSSIAVTGWALDDIGVESVKIYRGEPDKLVYIGDAVFVEGARLDVEQAYPGYPMNYKAGWGYMMLTNFLPDGGNGTFKIHAIAADVEGHQVTLGTKTITVDNANAVKPFGTIDTPPQGGIATGSSFINWGWVLTPLPNRIPTDGSTIKVWVDGINIGQPTYNIYRWDIARLFPGYNNTDGAAGYFFIDTTAYENGVHTIQWTATDNAGNTDGIGSRYFTIQNTGSTSQSKYKKQDVHLPGDINLSRLPVDHYGHLLVKNGYEKLKKPREIYPDDNGYLNIQVKELDRVEIHFSIPVSNTSPLPVGSTLDAQKGIFYWGLGPGFHGDYELAFVDARGFVRKINIKVTPK